MISILGRSMVLLSLAVCVIGTFAGIAGGAKRSETTEMGTSVGLFGRTDDDRGHWIDGICIDHQ